MIVANATDEKTEETNMNNKSKSSRLRGITTTLLCLCMLICPLHAEAQSEAAPAPRAQISSRLLDLFLGKEKTKSDTLYLCPSGHAFGMKLCQSGATVTAIRAPESPIGKMLAVGDIILSIDGTPIEGAAALCQRLGEMRTPFSLTVLRGNEKKSFTVHPDSAEQGTRLGIEVKDTAAGIGTITFIDPTSGAFGGLGHGICSPISGELYPMKSGKATEVILGGVHKGAEGKPGELRGVLSHTEIGTLESNTACGVFGTITDIGAASLSDPLPVGTRAEVALGDAEILSSIKNGAPARYTVRITDIDRDARDSKSFRIEVTDPALIALTGGIVRGMSGSPIIQDGKLVGAVTHVMVANPTEGYGIFIENMLEAAQQGVQPKAA